MQNSGLKNQYFKEIQGKINILSTHNFLNWKFAVSVGKLQLPVSLTVLTNVAASCG